jgi:hypothetical protein
MRTLAGMGNLLSALQVGREGLPTAREIGQDRLEVDASNQCPAVAPMISTEVPSKLVSTSDKPPVMLAPIVAAPPPETIQQALDGWTAAWSSKDFPRYRSYYAQSFTPEEGVPLAQWASERAIRLGKPGNITIGINDLKVDTPDANKSITEFKQTYTSANYRDEVTKRMEWIREGGRWKIQREQVLSTTKASVPDLIKPAVKKKKKKRVKKPSTNNCKCD